MKEITQQEFQQEIEKIINGETTRKKLAEELETNCRTLNNKIMELSQTNPELYLRFIKLFPYKPKEIQVDVESLAIDVIRYGLTETAEKTGISTRTITRKVKGLEKTNPKLYALYRARNTKEEKNISYYIRLEECEQMIQADELEQREGQLKSVLAKFEELVSSGMSKAKAARTLGYDDYPTIWKKYQELKRIETERKAQQSEESEIAQTKSDFRKRMKVNISKQQTEQSKEQKEKQKQMRVYVRGE